MWSPPREGSSRPTGLIPRSQRSQQLRGEWPFRLVPRPSALWGHRAVQVARPWLRNENLKPAFPAEGTPEVTGSNLQPKESPASLGYQLLPLGATQVSCLSSRPAQRRRFSFPRVPTVCQKPGALHGSSHLTLSITLRRGSYDAGVCTA